jgi:DNA-binding SARP family transcriptional activator
VSETVYQRFAYQADLVEAYLAWRSADFAACSRLLRAALDASRHDASKFFLRLQPSLLPILCAYALQAGIAVAPVRRLIAELRLRPVFEAPRSSQPVAVPDTWPWRLRVFTLGRFAIHCDDQPLESAAKVPKKVLGLLKALIALGGSKVTQAALLDAFWRGEEHDAAVQSLSAALLRLRALLGDALLEHGDTLSLDRASIWVDAWAFERAMALEGATAAAAPTLDLATIDDAQLATTLDLYGGGFLAQDERAPWAAAMRDRLRVTFVDALAHYASRLEARGRLVDAIRWYQRGVDADPLSETFHQGLMRCFDAVGRRSDAISAYRRLQKLLSATPARTPSPATESLYQSMRDSG